MPSWTMTANSLCLFAGPVLQTGHGAGKPLSKTLDEVRDVYCFIAAACGAKYSSQAE